MVDFFGPFSLAWGAATGKTPMEHLDPNGGDEGGSVGGHDPSQAPPQGFSSWQDVEESNMDSIAAAEQRQAHLESQGFKYNGRNGTWKAPDGRTTTMFAGDSGPPGGVDYHWDEEQQQEEPEPQPSRPWAAPSAGGRGLGAWGK